MKNLVKQDQDRLRLLKKYGYDIPKIRNSIIAKVGLSFDANMLEVGTGRGHMAVALARKGFKFVSIDLDKNGQEVAKINLKALKSSKSVSFKIMNAEKLRYKDSSFDYVVSVDFIHHAKHPVKCLKEMVRVVKSTLIIADINKRGARIMEKVHRLNGHSHAPSKISLKEMEVLLKRAGMKVRVYRDVHHNVIIAKKGAAK